MTIFQRLGLSAALSALFVPAAAFFTHFAWPLVAGLSLLFFAGSFLSSFYLRPSLPAADLAALKDKTAVIVRETREFHQELLAMIERYADEFAAALSHYRKTGKFPDVAPASIIPGLMQFANRLSDLVQLLDKNPQLLYGSERIFVLMPLARNLVSKLEQHDLKTLSAETRARCEDGVRLLTQASQELFQSSRSAHEKDITLEVRVLEETLKIM